MIDSSSHILVVDDDPEIAHAVADYLTRQAGYQVTQVSNGRKAIEYVGKHRVDLVLLDMIMPPGIDP